MIPPGKTLGLLGGGVHGRLFELAAVRLGYRAQVFAPAAGCDPGALAGFAQSCDVVTWGGADLPLATLRMIETLVQVHPAGTVLEICQDQAHTKEWLRLNGFPAANDGAEVATEIAVVLARTATAAIRVYPPAEIPAPAGRRDYCVAPARVAPEVAAAAEKMARLIAEKLGLVGVMGVYIGVTHAGQLMVRQLVPGTHDGGNWTLDACMTSQFEQQVRAICGLPLGAVTLLSPVVMVNTLGDAWAKGEPDWSALLAQPNVRLHLYGKAEPRPGRKMGHFTVTARDADMTLELARKYQARLG